MPGITPNINLNRPFGGEAVGSWDTLVNPNWDIIDALFSGIGSSSPGGTGHMHNGLPGQGPQISHTSLLNIGTKTHDQLETNLSGVESRLTLIESDYCADATCGAGQGGGGSDVDPPLHYTDNFTTVQGTPLAANDWLVSSDSGLADFQTSGHSAFLSTLMGLKCVDRYAAVVKCQIPHSTAQRVTYHVSRLVATWLENADGVMMVMALMSTHLLGANTPFIHACGIKFVLSLTKAGGTFTVTRSIVAEQSDGVFQILKQDTFPGLTFNAAEIHFRGCHEFSTDENGAVWYYHNRAPVYILPSGAVTPYYAPIQLTLLGLGEPAFGSIGFGWAWDLDPEADLDIEMAWLTIDSKSNVEDPYTTSYPDPGNTPPPFDPTPGTLCCGGAGPLIGALVDLGDGLFLKAVACTTDPVEGTLLENGQVFPCNVYAAPTGGDPGPSSVIEGDTFTREVPIENMTPPANTEYVISGEEAFDYLHVELNSMGATITGKVKDGSFGFPDPTITFMQKTNGANTYGPVTICLLAAGTLSIDSIDFIDPFNLPLTDVFEGDYTWIKITTTGFTSPGPFPVPLAPADLSIVGDTSVFDQAFLRADNEIWARLLLNDEQLPYNPGQKIDISVTRGASTVTDSRQIREQRPILNGIWITADSTGPLPSGLNPGATITFDVYGWHFDDDAGSGWGYLVLPALSPHVIAAQPTYVNQGKLTGAQITIGGAPGAPIDFFMTNPDGTVSGASQAMAIVADANPVGLGPLTATITLDGTPVPALYEGQWLHIVLDGISPRPSLPQYDLEMSVGVPLLPYTPTIRNFYTFNSGATDSVSFDMLIPTGLVGAPVSYSLARYQAAFQAIGALGVVAAEPAPSGTPTASPLYPGATGTTVIGGVGHVFLPGVRVYGSPSSDITINSVAISTPFSDITVNYTVSSSTVPGTALSLVVENFLGTTTAIFLGNATRPPVVISSIDVSPCENVEGRTNVPFTVHGEHFDPVATISIIAGPGTVHDVTWVSDTEMTFLADFPIAPAGGNPYTVQISNPAPDPSSATAVLTLNVESVPRVGIVLLPATPGAGRTLQLVGQNVYCIDDVCPSDSNFSFTNLAAVVWTRKSNLMWEGTCTVTGLPGQTIVGSVGTPGGHSYAGIASALIRAASIVPAPTAFSPTGVEAATLVAFRIDGSAFDSVAVLRAKTSALVPIGESQTTNMQITALSPDWVVGKITLPNGVADAVYDVEFYDVTLALIGTFAAAFTAVKGALTPYITNKATPFSLVPGANVTVTFTLDPATPILNPAAWSVANGTLLSAVDVSAGAGTAWQLNWINGAAGPFEIRVVAPVLPVTFDVVRRTL